MKRERVLVSTETRNQIVDYLWGHWNTAFGEPRFVLESRKLEMCKPLNKEPWTYTSRGKEHPLLRIRAFTRRFVIEPCGTKGWRLAVVNMNNIIGFRIHKRGTTGRWGEVHDPKGMEELGKRFIRSGQAHHPRLMNSDLFYDEVTDHEVGGYRQIRYTVCLRTGKDLLDAPSSTIQRWLIRDMKVPEDSRGMNGLVLLLSRLLEDERPGKGGVKILSGPEILQAYAREDGAHSCMTGRAHTSKIEFYALNTNNCMLAVIYSTTKCTGPPVARLIIWKQMEGDTEVWFPDRVYPPHAKHQAKARAALLEYLSKKKNIEVRWFREEGYKNPDDNEWAGDEEYRASEGGDGAKKDYSPVMKLKLPESMIMPYMDTMLWAQVLSDGDGLFARSSKRLLPIGCKSHKGCPITLEDGVSVLCKPIQMTNTDGGRWAPVWSKCKCGNKYNSNPPESFSNRYAVGYWSTSTCKECFEKKYVTPWTYFKPSNGVPYHSVESPQLKDECKWSKNLDAWVYPEGNNAKRYLIWDNADKDWYLHNDERWAKKKEDHGEHPTRTSTDVTSLDITGIGGPDTESEEERFERRSRPANYVYGRPLCEPYQDENELQPTATNTWTFHNYNAPPPPHPMITIRQPNGTMRHWNESDLRRMIDEYQRACRTQSQARQIICRQIDSGAISGAQYTMAMSRHNTPDMSAYGFDSAEWNYAMDAGWVQGAIPQGDNP